MASIENIIPNGSMIKAKIASLEGMVTGVCVRGIDNSMIEYNVSRIVQGERKSEWYFNHEIEIKEESKPVGFHKATK